jgi:hypothetical protein
MTENEWESSTMIYLYNYTIWYEPIILVVIITILRHLIYDNIPNNNAKIININLV